MATSRPRPQRDGPPLPEGQKAVRPKPAASLILARRDADGPRFLMGRRHGGHAFMPDRWVFPGGRLDRPDHRAPAATELTPDAVAIFDRHGQARRARGLAQAAVRETLEEAGLQLAQVVGETALPDLAALSVLARAVTPPDVARRYDTWFFLAEADRLLSHERLPDCGELDEIAWMTAAETETVALPAITRLILAEAGARLAEASRPPASFRFVGATRVIGVL